MEDFNWHHRSGQEWDKKAEFWNNRSEQMWEDGSRKTIIPFVKKYFKLGGVVADIGCGDGYGSQKLAKENYQVVGIDLSKEMIEKASLFNNEEKLTFIQADARELPFKASSVDAIIAINCLEWTEDPKHVLLEFQRVLKPNGFFCAGILGPTAGPRQHSYPRLFGEKVICNTMMPWEFENLAKAHDWDIVDGHGIYKKEVQDEQINSLPKELKQALTFMWVSMLINKSEK
ncbi:class I SAM-dependent methyltransferase [Cytobacillus sp. IB215665]|uniref:class I SAM-dependent methyltransferase n=1 Tax=Cytobacillus sp. IB215665 TaxID=3097357 RepID=UPI002A0B1850|nr:methyltransferase domain-containing protein [Cytobacillus sp. IB215665]MDX8366520.1 methyltransferase domain-containing protein [Cytobacillus sp. IB215665]